MTSRTLVIMRHAKAAQTESGADIDRPLTTRGKADATAAGAWLAGRHIAPEVILCSHAARTRSTWHSLAVGFMDGPVSVSPTVQYEADLYFGGLSAAFRLIRAVDPAIGTVLLVGHNPTVSALSFRLDDGVIRAAGGLRTSGIAVHEVTADWADCVTAKLVDSHTARG